MNDMNNDFSPAYNQYLGGLDTLMKLPGELKSMLATAIKEQSAADAELEKETATIKSRLSKLKTSSESEYTSIHQELADANVAIPPRQRPSGGAINLTAALAFENQKKAAESVTCIIQQIKNIERRNEAEARNVTAALEERKRLATERLKREEQEREQERLRLQQEEQRRLWEEQQRLEAQRRAAEAMRKKSKMGCGTIAMLGILLTAILILILFL